jgi:arylsulfatase A-like enzyme
MPDTIVLVVLDSLRYDVFYNYLEKDESPFLKSFVESNVDFTGATATAPWSLPSHASMFTGMYPREHGALRANTRIGKDTPTLINRLNDHGFTTACFTANGFINPEFGFSGWDHRPDHYGHARFPDGDSPLSDETGISKIFDALGQVANSEKPHKSLLNAIYAQAKRSPPVADDHGKIMTRDLVQWLDQLPRREDLFLFCNYMETHDYHKQLSSLYKRLWNVAHKSDLDTIQSKLRRTDLDPNEQVFSDQESSLFKRIMMDELRYVDHLLDNINSALHQNGRGDDCVFIICSDHGEGAGEQGFVYHALGGLTEPIVRVPLIISAPNQRGSTIKKRVSLSWLYSSVLNFINDNTGPDLLDYKTFEPLVASENTMHILDIIDSKADIDEYYLKNRTAVYESNKPKRKHVRAGNKNSTYAIEPDGLDETLIGSGGYELVERFGKEHKTDVGESFEPDNSTKRRLRDLGYI